MVKILGYFDDLFNYFLNLNYGLQLLISLILLILFFWLIYPRIIYGDKK